MLGAESPHFSACNSGETILAATLLATRPRVDSDHSVRGVRAAKLQCLASDDDEPRLLRAALVGALVVYDVDHPLLGVCGTELRSSVALQAVRRPDDAPLSGTALIPVESLIMPSLACIEQNSRFVVPLTPHAAGSAQPA